MQIFLTGPERLTINGPAPSWFMDETGAHWDFDRPARKIHHRAFDLYQFEEGDYFLQGGIYRRRQYSPNTIHQYQTAS